MKYHGARYVHGTVSIVIRNPRISGNLIVFDAKCDKLGDNNLCKIHQNKPNICIGFNKETAKTNKYYTPETCIWS